MAAEVVLGNVMVDCGDEQSLREFYASLLGWERCELYGHPAVRSGGVVFLFQQLEGYTRPIWPEEEGQQQNRCTLTSRWKTFPRQWRGPCPLGAVKAGGSVWGGTLSPCWTLQGIPSASAGNRANKEASRSPWGQDAFVFALFGGALRRGGHAIGDFLGLLLQKGSPGFWSFLWGGSLHHLADQAP